MRYLRASVVLIFVAACFGPQTHAKDDTPGANKKPPVRQKGELAKRTGKSPQPLKSFDFEQPGSPKFENPARAKTRTEERILEVIDEMTEDDNRRWASVSPADGRFLRQMTEAKGAKLAVEIGTSTGYSGLWLAMALKTTGGRLVTFEIDPERAKQALENFEKAGVSDIITLVQGDAHQKLKELNQAIDIVFLDADKPGYVDYLAQLLPKIRPGGLILAHNMNYPRPDPRYIDAITKNPNLETLFVLMDGAGLSVTLKKR
jgi:predicted O-methyltransferase YrrM